MPARTGSASSKLNPQPPACESTSANAWATAAATITATAKPAGSPAAAAYTRQAPVIIQAAMADTRPARRRSCVPRESGTWKSTTITVLRKSTAATSTSGAEV